MPDQDLLTAELELTGPITTASNATYLGNIGEVSVVYKPIAGEKPLWDFPHATLTHRKVAAYLVSKALGWNLVPRTWMRDGLGVGRRGTDRCRIGKTHQLLEAKYRAKPIV